MKNDYGGIWIDKDCKKYYLDSSKQGLRLVFRAGIPNDCKDEIKKHMKYLRKLYFFPVRCKVHFWNQDSFLSKDGIHRINGLLLYDEEEKELPEIHVPITSKGKIMELENIIYTLNQILTYYYQWYFYEDKERTHRSLEIEATKYATYLTDDYITNFKLP